MNILIVGMGYVGVTTGLVFAELGWRVTGFDTNEAKLNRLAAGALPFYEPGLDALLVKHSHEGGIRFTSDLETALRQHQVIFLCVGTPSRPDGSADLQYVRQAAEQIGSLMTEYKLVVIKSTVPVGTNEQVVRWIGEAARMPVSFDVVSNPEFLREGSALHDALHPDRIVIGSTNEQATRVISSLYKDMTCPLIVTSPHTAEMIKYAANAFLATKISFINELSRLCDRVGVSIADVARGIGTDARIGPHFLRAGIGFGGSCFPKDIQALLYTASEHDSELTLLKSVVAVNQSQIAYAVQSWERSIGSFRHKTVAMLGLSFKPDTDDQRESPALAVLAHLREKQAIVRVHDPVSKLPDGMASESVRQFETLEETIAACDAVILCTEWQLYTKADWARLKEHMRQHYFFDGRNALDGKRMTSLGFSYRCLGHP